MNTKLLFEKGLSKTLVKEEKKTLVREKNITKVAYFNFKL